MGRSCQITASRADLHACSWEAIFRQLCKHFSPVFQVSGLTMSAEKIQTEKIPTPCTLRLYLRLFLENCL